MTQSMRIRRKVAPFRSIAVTGLVTAMAMVTNGCDPVINIAGANFPGWLLCSIVGIALAGLLRPLFVALGVESHMGPGLLIYPCLVVLIGCLTWLILFNRV